MKTTTTTREYDAKGKLVKETVVVAETSDAGPPMIQPTVICTCRPGHFGRCLAHGYIAPRPVVVLPLREDCRA